MLKLAHLPPQQTHCALLIPLRLQVGLLFLHGLFRLGSTLHAVLNLLQVVPRLTIKESVLVTPEIAVLEVVRVRPSIHVIVAEVHHGNRAASATPLLPFHVASRLGDIDTREHVVLLVKRLSGRLHQAALNRR